MTIEHQYPVAERPRGPFQGVAQIFWFNWPMYATAALSTLAATVVLAFVPLPTFARLAVMAATLIGLFWAAASLVVSYWVYDASPLCRWEWVADELRPTPRLWINVHCGFDESTPALRRLLSGASGRVLDLFDPAEMTEPSILRARGLADPATRGEPADYRRLPAENDSIDAAFLMLSAHELRTAVARRTLFVELLRVVRPGGTVVVAEHMRDAANFIAFGPGFVHFHSRAAWLRTFREAGWLLERERRITPFVAVFVLRRPG